MAQGQRKPRKQQVVILTPQANTVKFHVPRVVNFVNRVVQGRTIPILDQDLLWRVFSAPWVNTATYIPLLLVMFVRLA